LAADGCRGRSDEQRTRNSARRTECAWKTSRHVFDLESADGALANMAALQAQTAENRVADDARIRGMAEKPAARTFITEQSENNLTDFYFAHINPS